jgi:hypothetical protein
MYVALTVEGMDVKKLYRRKDLSCQKTIQKKRFVMSKMFALFEL